MKLTNNHKILLGLAIGGGIAWWLTRKKSATATSTTSNTVEPKDLTREEKINYILDNVTTTPTEEKTGFSGERFEYDPAIGYAIPFGTVKVQSASGEMVLPREGNLAQEVYFNAEGEATNNPVEEAEAILDALTDEELDVAYRVSKARVKNPNISDEQLIKIANLKQKGQDLFLGLIKNKFNDVKALSKNPNWRKGLSKKAYRFEKRKQRRKNRKDRMGMMGMSKEERRLKKQCREKYGVGKDYRKCLRTKFEDEVINRQNGAMWGGYRNDGMPTNADAVVMQTRPMIISRGNAINERSR
jgi:hypothetical protein